jgi:hypothetical protein
MNTNYWKAAYFDGLGGATSTSCTFSGDEYATTYTLSANENKASNLLDQIIEKAEFDDLEHRKQMITEHQGEKSIGESWMCFHLKQLKKLSTGGE